MIRTTVFPAALSLSTGSPASPGNQDARRTQRADRPRAEQIARFDTGEGGHETTRGDA